MKTTHIRAHTRNTIINPFTVKHDEIKQEEETKPKIEKQFGAEVIGKNEFTDAEGNKHKIILLKKHKGKNKTATYAATEQITKTDGQIKNITARLPKVDNDKKAAAGFNLYVAEVKLASSARVTGKAAAKIAKESAKKVGEFATKEIGVFKGWLAKKKQERETAKAIKEEAGTKLETYE